MAQADFAFGRFVGMGRGLGQHRRGTGEIIRVVQGDDIGAEHLVRGVAKAITHRWVGKAADMVCGQDQNHVGRMGDKSRGQPLAPDQRLQTVPHRSNSLPGLPGRPQGQV